MSRTDLPSSEPDDRLELAPCPHLEPFEYTFHLPGDARAVGVARTALRAVLRAHHVPELVERAELLASELLTNAVTHTDGTTALRLKWANQVLRLSVWDNSGEEPRFHRLTDDCEHGRGLYLLTILADRWNHFPLDGEHGTGNDGEAGKAAKVVWCEVGLAPPLAW